MRLLEVSLVKASEEWKYEGNSSAERAGTAGARGPNWLSAHSSRAYSRPLSTGNLILLINNYNRNEIKNEEKDEEKKRRERSL